MRARRSVVGALAALVAAFTLAACGSDDFPNDPRPAAPIELSARIADQTVNLSPTKIGAGLATITISNQSQDPGALVLEGPTDEQSEEIPPGGTGAIKVNLEQGDYTVSAKDSSAHQTRLTVGPKRKTSQNDLLLP